MKIIVGNHITQNNICFWAFDDDKTLTPERNMTTVGDPPEFVIGDLGTYNSTIYENITDVPEDWAQCKYLYDGTTWTANEGYVTPEEMKIRMQNRKDEIDAETARQAEEAATAEAESVAAAMEAESQYRDEQDAARGISIE